MKRFLTLLLATLCAATSYAQTIKTLGYNTTNNTVVGLTAGQRIEFERLGVVSGTASVPSIAFATGTNALGLFSGTEFGVGPFLGFSVNEVNRFSITTNALIALSPLSFNNVTNAAVTRTNLGLGATWLTNDNVTNFITAIGLHASTEIANQVEAAGLFDVPNGDTAFYIQDNEVFITGGAVANFRASLGIPLPALTNTSNVTIMRALAGSTNTNQPFSGLIRVQEEILNDSVNIIISNGIIVGVEQ